MGPDGDGLGLHRMLFRDVFALKRNSLETHGYPVVDASGIADKRTLEKAFFITG